MPESEQSPTAPPGCAPTNGSVVHGFLNRIFGWDYIRWENSADCGISRVHVDGRGVVWYWRYRITSVADVIESPERVIWLTCSASKYFPKGNE